MTLRDLGVGLVCLPGLEPIVESIGPDCQVIEVEPQPFWVNAAPGGALQLNAAALDRIVGLGRPLLVHSVGYPVGGSETGDRRHLPALRETFDRLRPAWWSEHMSFVAAGCGPDRRFLGFLMPPVQSAESIALIADRIKSLQDLFGLPFAFETGVNYLRPLEEEIPDGAFWGEIAVRANCGILFDLHNVWANARNGRPSVEEVVSQLPLDHIWEMHLAGGQDRNGYWLDSHSGLPPSELLTLAKGLVPRLPALRAMILEIIPDYLVAADLTAEQLANCLAAMSAIWALRGTATGAGEAKLSSGLGPAARIPPSPGDWEEALRRALLPDGLATRGPFADDPALDIYRDLIAMARRGTIADSLRLSTRYLFLALGEAALEELLQGFWRASGPEPFMSDEAVNFAEHVSALRVLPHLDEVLAFELAAHRAAMTGSVQRVHFTCEPESLLESLKQGILPDRLERAHVEVEVLPPAEDSVTAPA